MRTKVIAGVFFLTAVSFGQFETSEVLGTVHDPQQMAVANATVSLTNQGTGIQARTTTNQNGEYDFLDVKPGTYAITVEQSGFSKFSSMDIAVAVNSRQRVDAELQVGAVSDTVTVTGAASLVETDTSAHSQVIGTQTMVDLPLNGRQYSSLALLSTNVHVSPIAISFSPSGTPREGSFNVNGMRSTYNDFLLDGLDNNSYGTSNQNYSSQVVQPSPDALSEFRVITSNFSAEYGRVGGGVVNAALKSGTNEFHGALWEFLRNTDLNAIGYVFGAPSIFQKPTLHRNQFGLAVGGPIIRNKLFFFGDYEGFRQTQGYLNQYSLPDANDRNGILPVTVIDPVTGQVFPAGTQIPVKQLNPFAAAALAGLAAPNNGSATSRANNLLETIPLRDFSDKYDAKLDYQITSAMTGLLRFSQRKDISYFGPADPGPSGGDGNGFIHAIQQQAAAGYTWAISSTSLLDARFGFSHILGGKQPPYLGGPDIASEFGIQGLPSSLSGGFPTQVISGFSNPTAGRQATNPQFQNPTSFDPKFNYSLVKGRHSIKAGYEFLAIRTEVLDINPIYGMDTYAGGFSKPTAAQCGCTPANDTTSYNLADFYFGLPSQVAQGNALVTNLRQHVHSLYIQDDFRVTPKLTLNLGLRWDFATPIWDRDNYWSNFDPVSNSLVRATNGSLYNRSLVNPDYKDWGPRLGFAWAPDSKTSVRSGYGISYSYFNRPGSAIEGINGPLSIFGVINQSFTPGGTVPAGFLNVYNGFATGVASTFNPVLSNNDYIPANTRWPYIQSWVFSVQREIAKDTIIEVAYNGNHSLRLPILGDYNQAAPQATASGTLGVQARRPDQSFGAITWVDPAGDNHYNGLSVRFEHRFSRGLYILNAFTWSNAIGDSEQALEYYSNATAANPQNIYNLGAERGPSSFDVKLMNVSSVVYNLPFGKGQRFVNSANPVLDRLVGGWQLSGINTANTGTPINVYYAPNSATDVTGLTAEYRGQAILRPNVSCTGGTNQSTAQMLLTYFAGCTFTTPAANAPFGNLGRNAFRAPSLEQWDLAVNKDIAFTETIKLQFRSEFFNILNHTNFGVPNQQSNSTAFGTITNAYPPRQIQFGLKLLF
ncbi:MAG TPA: TonB-dependent receptor [Bryobacteraceae bacterium]|nr:TonB-dependent receptor [Bryobacteraceae bacterium]